MALILYSLTAALLLGLAHRLIAPISKWAALILFALPLAIAGEALFTSRVLAPVDLIYEHPPMNWMKEEYGIGRASTGMHTDVFLEFIPWRKAAQWSVARGEWGLRNPFTFAGEPLLAGEQEAITWPLTWIALLLPVMQSFSFTIAITMLIAALSAFLLARELGCREGAALVAAIGWAFASAMVMYLLVAMSAVWAWAPLVLVGVGRVVRVNQIGVLTFAFTAILAAGHPESALYAVMIGMLFGVFELAQHRHNAIRATLLALAAGVLALLLSAIHLLPFFEAMPHSDEYAHRETIFRYQKRGVPDAHVVARTATTFFPYLYGRTVHLKAQAPPMHTTAAAGSIILALAIYAIWRARRRETWFFAAAFTFCLLLGAEWRPLARFFARVPVFDIALGDRMITGAALLLSILAALGAEEWSRRNGDRAAGFTFLAVLAVLAAGNAMIVKSPLVDHNPMNFGEHVVIAEIAALALVAIVLLTRTKATVPLLLALLLAQRALSVGDIYKSFDKRQAYPPIPMLAPLEHIKEPFRIVGHGLAFPPATSTLYELEDIRGYSAMTFRRLKDTYPLWCVEQPVWFNRVDDLTRPFLSTLNVRYALTWDREPPPEGWREVARQRGSLLIENTRAFSRAFVPPMVHVSGSAEENVGQMKITFDFTKKAWIEVPGAASHDVENGPGTVTIRHARLGYELAADMQRDGWIVISESAWPGWRATIDGRRAETRIANHAFLGVHVPAGKHAVRLTYWPRSFAIGGAITVLTVIALSIVALVRHRRKSLLQRRDAPLAALPLGQ